MAVRWKSKKRRAALHPSSEEGLEKAAQLAPLEERAARSPRQSSNNGGSIVVDTGALKLPSEFTEKGKEKSGLLGLEPVTIVILVLALAFIAFITYLIAVEPPKDKEESLLHPPRVENSSSQAAQRPLVKPSRSEATERGSSPAW